MNTKDFVLKRNYIPEEPKYKISNLYCAFTDDGSSVCLFTFNQENTKIKDIFSSDNIAEIKDGDNKQAIISALSAMLSIDSEKINYTTLIDMIKYHTYGISIPGKIFTDVRKEVWASIDRRADAINAGSLHKLKATATELKPLKKQLSTNLQSTCIKGRQSVIINNEDDFLKF